jgi:DNA (cytosine-5)-methyltransferase 1
MKPILLDLMCGAGGCTRGYQEAGFYVVGVDIEPQPNYCGDEFVQGDALSLMEEWSITPSSGFDAIHASPPCQAYAMLATDRKRDDHPELLDPCRELLRASGLPWVIENVPTAPMPDSFVLCGSTFGLPVVRHRRFEVNPVMGLHPSNCHQTKFARAVDHGPGFHPYGRKTWEPAWREHVLPVVWPWMTLAEAGQAIPPAYTEYIGAHLLEHIEAEEREAA